MERVSVIQKKTIKFNPPYFRRTHFRLCFTKMFVSDISVTLTQVKPFLLLPFHSKEILKRLGKESGFCVFGCKELRKIHLDLMEGK